MKLVRAGLRNRINDGPRIASVFRIDYVCYHLEFFDGIGTGNNQRSIQREVVGVSAINQIAVLLCLTAVGREIAARIGCCDYTWLDLLQIHPVAADERDVHDLTCADNRAELCRDGINLYRVGLHGDRLGNLAYFHLNVLLENLVYVYMDLGDCKSAKALFFGSELIVTDTKLLKIVYTFFVCDRCVRDTGSDIRGCDFYIGYHRAPLIQSSASNASVEVVSFSGLDQKRT